MPPGFLLCKSIAKNKMRYFLAPSGQPKMMRKNFMHSDCCQLSWCAILRMKFYTKYAVSVEKNQRIRSLTGSSKISESARP